MMLKISKYGDLSPTNHAIFLTFLLAAGWAAVGGQLHAIGHRTAHARYPARLRGPAGAAHQVLAGLQR